MNSQEPFEPVQILNVGPDRVTVMGRHLVIDAVREIADWKAREFNRRAIYFRDQKYFLRGRADPEPPFAERYVLQPWPENDTEPARSFDVYDEHFVHERDESARLRLGNTVAGQLLLPAYPFLGLLWSGPKDRLTRFGFVPRDITSASIMLVFIVVFMEGAFTEILMLGAHLFRIGGIFLLAFGPGALAGALDVLLLGLMIVDILKRLDQHIRNDEREQPWGFLEWLFTRRPGPFV